MLFPLIQRHVIRGAKEHIAQGLLAATDYVAPIGTPIYASAFGIIYHFDDQGGGMWIGIRRDDGLHFEFAHLSQRIALHNSSCKPGDVIALTGNSGDMTAMGVGKVLPHLHHQLIQGGKRLDPEEFYIAYSVPVIALNGSVEVMTATQDKILEYSQSMATISWDLPQFTLPDDPDQSAAYQAIDDFLAANPKQYLPNRFFILFTQGSNAFARTYYYPKKKCTVSVIPANGHDPKTIAFEISHAWQTCYNTLRGQLPYIEVVDSNFPDDVLITNKYRSVLPYIEVLNKL